MKKTLTTQLEKFKIPHDSIKLFNITLKIKKNDNSTYLQAQRDLTCFLFHFGAVKSKKSKARRIRGSHEYSVNYSTTAPSDTSREVSWWMMRSLFVLFDLMSRVLFVLGLTKRPKSSKTGLPKRHYDKLVSSWRATDRHCTRSWPPRSRPRARGFN